VLPHQSLGLRIDIYTTPALIESELPHELLDLCLARSNEITGEVGDNGIQHLVGYVVHSNLSFRNLFVQADFTLARYIFEMRKEMPTPPDKSHWPAGIHVRTFKPEQDGFATYELVQEAFDRPGRVRYSFENWKTHMLRPDSFNPDLWTLAFDEGELVGVCLGFNYSQEGWIRQLGVKASAQGRGIGSALLRNAFNTFYSLGKRRVGLTVESDNPDALTFYYRTGMTIKRQYDEYVKVVAPP
jgi:mycothiol synthase